MRYAYLCAFIFAWANKDQIPFTRQPVFYSLKNFHLFFTLRQILLFSIPVFEDKRTREPLYLTGQRKRFRKTDTGGLQAVIFLPFVPEG
jgi:hypothetical protein